MLRHLVLVVECRVAHLNVAASHPDVSCCGWVSARHMLKTHSSVPLEPALCSRTSMSHGLSGLPSEVFVGSSSDPYKILIRFSSIP
jgi:hypothetical protein